MKETIYSFVTAISWLIISTFLLCLPGSKIPKQDWLDDIRFDKWVHIGMFAILIFLWCRAIAKKFPVDIRNKTWFVLISLGGLAYGVGMEFTQLYLVASRSFDGWDILADAFGCFIGLFFSLRIFLKKKTPVETGVVNQN